MDGLRLVRDGEVVDPCLHVRARDRIDASLAPPRRDVATDDRAVADLRLGCQLVRPSRLPLLDHVGERVARPHRRRAIGPSEPRPAVHAATCSSPPCARSQCRRRRALRRPSRYWRWRSQACADRAQLRAERHIARACSLARAFALLQPTASGPPLLVVVVKCLSGAGLSAGVSHTTPPRDGHRRCP